MIDRFDGQVDIEVGPIEMVRMRQFDVAELADRHIAEPWKVLECEEPLLLVEQQPEAVPRDVCDFNDRSGLSTRGGFHLHAPEQGGGHSQADADSSRSSAQARFVDPTRTLPRPLHGKRARASEIPLARRSSSETRLLGESSDS